MPGIVDRLFAAKASPMLADDDPVLANDDPVGVSMDFDRTANGARLGRVFVAIEPDKAGLGHRRVHRMEAVEAAAQLHELLPYRQKNARSNRGIWSAISHKAAPQGCRRQGPRAACHSLLARSSLPARHPGFAFVWLAVLLLVLAALLIAWGQAPERTEAFVGRLPYGNSLLKSLANLDLMLSDRS
jgi:hypothetical protein